MAPIGHPIHYCPFQIGANAGQIIHLFWISEKWEFIGHS